MKQCPQCKKNFATGTIRGPIVYGEVGVRFDNNGQVAAVGVVTPYTVIKAGQEVKGKFMRLTCENCGYEGSIHDFITIAICPFTGERATVTITVPQTGLVFMVAEGFPLVDVLRHEAKNVRPRGVDTSAIASALRYLEVNR